MVTSLVLPCYNPPEGWEQVVQEQYALLCRQIPEHVELIVVMDGDSPGVKESTFTQLQQNLPGLKLIRYNENRGKGYAIRQGVNAATGDVILYTDVDFPYTTTSIVAVYTPLKNNECDVAAGVKDGHYYSQVPLLRRAISKYLRFLIGTLLSMPITDTQCGLKGFRREVMPLFLQTTIDRYLFDLEFIRNCFKNGRYRVRAIPVSLNENVHFRKMNYRILLPEMANFIKLLLRRN